jgi:hypothetical protein
LFFNGDLRPGRNWAKSFFIQGEDAAAAETSSKSRHHVARRPSPRTEEREDLSLTSVSSTSSRKVMTRPSAFFSAAHLSPPSIPTPLYFNLGNNFFAQGKNMMAVEMYTKA